MFIYFIFTRAVPCCVKRTDVMFIHSLFLAVFFVYFCAHEVIRQIFLAGRFSFASFPSKFQFHCQRNGSFDFEYVPSDLRQFFPIELIISNSQSCSYRHSSVTLKLLLSSRSWNKKLIALDYIIFYCCVTFLCLFKPQREFSFSENQ